MVLTAAALWMSITWVLSMIFLFRPIPYPKQGYTGFIIVVLVSLVLTFIFLPLVRL